MDRLKIRKCITDDLEKIKDISEKTFIETFSGENTKGDIENYLKNNFNIEILENELINDGSVFYIVETDEDVLAYMKVNFDKAQTEKGHKDTLEIQRIYVLKDFKNMNIGKKLINKAVELAKNHNLEYIWLGVWENNINAIRFYERLGFKKFDTHIFKLGDDEQTDNLMRLVL